MSRLLHLELGSLSAAGTTLDTAAGRLVVADPVAPARPIAIDPQEVAALVAAARAAADRAHIPYSRFPVGAALVMGDDPQRQIVTGANIENASHGATLCAERTALAQAAARGLRQLALIAVSCRQALDQPLAARMPCGICRQMIAEFAGPDTLVLVDTATPGQLADVLDMGRLLPFGFTLGFGR